MNFYIHIVLSEIKNNVLASHREKENVFHERSAVWTELMIN